MTEKEIYDKGVEWAKDIDNVTLIHGDYKDEISKLTDKFDGIYHSADKETVSKLLSFKDDIKSLAKNNCKLVMLNWHLNNTLINKANYKKITTSDCILFLILSLFKEEAHKLAHKLKVCPKAY